MWIPFSGTKTHNNTIILMNPIENNLILHNNRSNVFLNLHKMRSDL